MASSLAAEPRSSRTGLRARSTWREDPTLWLFPLIYALGAWLIYGSLGLLDSNRVATGPTLDLITELWFLSYWEHAVAHLHLSFWTDLFNYPQGMNLLHTASFPLLGALASPLTAIFGPVATLALLMRLALVVSALSAFLVFRRLVRSPVAAGIGGLVYGFSPYMVTQGPWHLFLVFVPLPPVILYLLYRALTGIGEAPAQRAGAIAGALTVVQFLISAEIAITTVVIAALTAAVFGASRLRAPGAAMLQRAGNTLAGFTAVAVVPMALLGWLTLHGRGANFGGPPGGPLGLPGINPWATVGPGANQVMGALLQAGPIGWTQSRAASGFLGPVLLVALVWIAARYWSRPLVRAATVMAVMTWLLALGAYLTAPDGSQTSIPMLWNLLARLPIIQEAEANRLALYLDIGVATLVVVAIDELVARRRALVTADRALAGLLVAGVLLAAPARSFPSAPINATAHTVTGTPIQHLIASGAVVTTLPLTVREERPPMTWQALAGMRFSLLGGKYARQQTVATRASSHLSGRQISCLLYPGGAWTGSRHCSAGLDGAAVIRGFIRRWSIAAVIATGATADARMIRLMNHLYPSHTHVGSTWVWRTGA